jgi:hypothetical protein
MSIFVTGGSGFVGINLVRRLAEKHPDSLVVVGDPVACDTEIGLFLGGTDAEVRFVWLDVTDREQDNETRGGAPRTQVCATQREADHLRSIGSPLRADGTPYGEPPSDESYAATSLCIEGWAQRARGGAGCPQRLDTCPRHG